MDDIGRSNGAVPSASTSKEVRLPGSGFLVIQWKVKNGSPVRMGETLALAIHKSDRDRCLGSSSSPSSQEWNNKISTNATGGIPTLQRPQPQQQHKRPRKRSLSKILAASAGTNNQLESLKKPKLPATIINRTTTSSQKKAAARKKTMNLPLGSEISADAIKKYAIPVISPGNGIFRKEDSINSTTASGLVIGFVEPCDHPTVVEGLCVVCGMPVNQNKEEETSKTSHPLSQVTVSYGVTMKVSKTEGERMALQSSQRLKDQKKLALVLDLDHTLVHATGDIRARQYMHRDDVRNIVLPMIEDVEGKRNIPTKHWMQHFIKLRPFVKEFLENAMTLYEVSVYTAGTRQYAEQITIILCRHMVGASKDQVELECLRNQVKQAEYDLKNQKGVLEQDEECQKEKGNSALIATKTDDGNKRNNGHQKKKKRKRVSFGISQEDYDRLRQDLCLAEKLERKAMELRRRLFGNRIVSRTDVGDLGRDVKSLKRVFPCGGTMAAVVDDREDVWANATENSVERKGEPPENVLLVKPYHWQPFLGFADVNNASGVDLSSFGDEKKSSSVNGENLMAESDMQLSWTLGILERLHERYYNPSFGSNSNSHNQNFSKTVPEILREMRGEILRGSNIVLSGLIPLHKQHNNLSNSLTPRPPVVRYCEWMGSTMQPSVQKNTSYVIAAKDGTDKTLAARKVVGCFIVKASWLMECLWSITKRDVKPHLLAPPLEKKPLLDLCGNNSVQLKPKAEIYEVLSSDEDDDDLVLELFG